MKSHHLERSEHLICGGCGNMLDGAINQDQTDIAPSKGDISLCFYCGNINMYDEVDGKLGLVTMPDAALESLITEQPMAAINLLAARQQILLNKSKEYNEN